MFFPVFRRSHPINLLEAFAEMLRIFEADLISHLGKVIRPLFYQFCRFLQTYVLMSSIGEIPMSVFIFLNRAERLIPASSTSVSTLKSG